MDKKKWIDVGLTVAAVIIPFGLITLGGYYGYRAYRKRKEEKEKADKQTEQEKDEPST